MSILAAMARNLARPIRHMNPLPPNWKQSLPFLAMVTFAARIGARPEPIGFGHAPAEEGSPDAPVIVEVEPRLAET